MAVITRRTLVLRGVSVLRDGLTVVARLGTGYQAEKQKPAPFAMPHPMPSNLQNQSESERWSNLDDDRDASSRAGRSAGSVRVPPTHRVPAIHAGAPRTAAIPAAAPRAGRLRAACSHSLFAGLIRQPSCKATGTDTTFTRSTGGLTGDRKS